MYIPRLLSQTFRKALKSFPAVLLTGPRQAGKTTFLLHEFGRESDYVSFDDPLEREFSFNDPNGFLDRFAKKCVILDEIQYVPHLFPYLKMRIDTDRSKNGRWILTGSQQFQLMKNVSESLAGRVAIMELLPFSLREEEQAVSGKKAGDRLERTVINGGYPEPFLHPEKRDIWVRSYIQTYIERDVRQLQNVKDIRTFESFLGIMAALHGQTFNSAVLSRRVGVSLPTIKTWASVLEASYLCYFLRPYFRNYGKRLVKTPKFYFLDTAIICALTRQPDAYSAVSGAMGGVIFEGLVVGEAVKSFTTIGRKPDIFFWRSHDGLEVDLIIQIGNKLHPVEIKLTATPASKHIEPLQKFKALAGSDAADTGILVCRTNRVVDLPSGNIAIPWRHFSRWLLKIISGKI